jgi:hypothetical protein
MTLPKQATPVRTRDTRLRATLAVMRQSGCCVSTPFGCVLESPFC